MAKRRVAKKAKKKAAPKKAAPRPAARIATAAPKAVEVSPEKVLDLLHELEEVTGKVKNAESEIVRSNELQADLMDNLSKQLAEQEVLEQKTNALTGERDALASDLAKVNADIATVSKELAGVAKAVEKAEARNADLSEKKDAFEGSKADLTEKNKELLTTQKSLAVDIEKLTKDRKDLTS